VPLFGEAIPLNTNPSVIMPSGAVSVIVLALVILGAPVPALAYVVAVMVPTFKISLFSASKLPQVQE